MIPTRLIARAALAVSLAVSLAARTALGQPTPAGAARDWSAVDAAIGRKGAAQPDGVMKYAFPRGDLPVTVGDVQLRPALALGGWLAFRDVGGGRAMAMGDLVLADSEVAPVMRALRDGGVEPTAVHNHLLGERPRVMYLHVDALGDPAAIARTVRAALGRTGTPPAAPPAAAAPLDLDTAAVARTLGVVGRVNGGVYQVSVPRREPVRAHGHEVPPSMGVATAINFQPTGGGRAAVTGDFVMVASEVSAVVGALQQGGIAVTALHSHMLAEEPRLFFMHFWATDDAVALARTLRAALDHMAVRTIAR